MSLQSSTSLGTRPPYPGIGAATREDIFHFHPRTTNPELWRTSLPLVVYERCDGHKGLLATWMAIHWLIVLHAASGRRAFGMREIASRARVGRNELAGRRGYIQRLVDLGLLRIVGHQRIPGLAEPRPVYHLDLWDLEQQSLALIPEVLRAQGVHAPPMPAPDPRQISFFDACDAPLASGTVAPPVPVQTSPQIVTDIAPLHKTGTATIQQGSAAHETGTEQPQIVPAAHETGTEQPGNGTDVRDSGTDIARNRDMEGEKEGNKEGVSEIAPTHGDFQQIAAQAAQAVIQLLRQQGSIPMLATTPLIPDAPPAPVGQPAIPADLLTLWQGDRTTLTARERHQLIMLVNELDAPTSGHGAYWVGRAILIADRCLSERGQQLNLNYLRAMLRRWQREDSWGSDLEIEREASIALLSRPTIEKVEPPAPLLPTDKSTQPEALSHPAVVRYETTFGHRPNLVQAQQIAEAVSNLSIWERVLTDWQAHNWRADSVPKMLDRYRTQAGAVPGAPASASVPNILEIYHYPDIDDAERQRWLYRFSHAGPDDRIMIMAKFREEYS